jgi:hypothetical protein
MLQSEIDDINRKLAILAAKHGFAATACKAVSDGATVLFQAFSWHGEEVLNHTASYPESELSRMGPVAIATQFIEAARSKLSVVPPQ